MTNKSAKTYLPKASEIKRRWYEIDASKFPLGRLASRVAPLLRGKHRVDFTPHMDMGDFVVVKNAKLVKFTGGKLAQKKYHRYSGYPGGLKTATLKEVMEKKPQKVIEDAVSRMLDPNRMRSKLMARLKVVLDDKHSFKIDKTIEK